MDRTVRVRHARGSYEVRIGSGLLDRFGEFARDLDAGRRLAVVTDVNVRGLHAERLVDALKGAGLDPSLHAVPAGESNKTLATVEHLCEEIARAGLDRGGWILALGGGVVGDLAGFTASVYLRGIPVVQAPTSLVAQSDASVGGKTAVDLPEGKNLVGTFHSPTAVWIDPAVLATLPDREFACGMAEVIKTALLGDAALLDRLESDVDRIVARDPATLSEVVTACVRVKGRIVSEDEEDHGARRLLNLGHTLGHALEAAEGYGGIPHGEAVAVGMVAATRLAADLGLLQDRTLPDRLVRLLDRYALPTARPFDPERVREYLMRDKKFRDGRPVWILPLAPGRAEVHEVPLKSVEGLLTAPV